MRQNTSHLCRLTKIRDLHFHEHNDELAYLLDDAMLELIDLKNMVDTGTAFAERVAEIVAKRVLRELRGEA